MRQVDINYTADTVKKIDYNLEVLRVVACVFVVLIHISNVYCRSFPEISTASYVFSVIIDAISRMGVPIFFMISGALIIGSQVDIKKNLKRTLVFTMILFVWTVIYIVWNYFYIGRTYDFANFFYEPSKRHLWYLYALVGLYFAIPLIQTLFQNLSKELEKYFVITWAIYLIFIYVSRLIGIKIKYGIPIIGFSYYLGLFIIGYLIKKYINQIKLKNIYILLVLFSSIAAIAVMTIGASFTSGKHVDTYFQYGNPLYALAAISLFVFVYKKRDIKLIKTKKIMQFISEASLGIYLIQIIFLDLIRFNYDILSLSAFIEIPVLFIIIFMASFAATTLLRQIPYVKKIV